MKNNTLKSIYATRKPDGEYRYDDFLSLLVYYPVSEDEQSRDAGTDFVTVWKYHGKLEKFCRNKIHYPVSERGRAYIRKGKSRRIYLDEIIRTDSPWMA